MSASVSSHGDIYDATGTVIVVGASMPGGAAGQVVTSDANGGLSLQPPSGLPQSQAFALANNTYQSLLQWTVTGQADSPLPPFGLIAGSQTYGTSPAVQGPAFWFGYNPALGSASVSSSPHGAVGMSVFGDAGDSNNGAGGHGLECNPATFRTPNGLSGTNALEMVAFDDNTNTVSTVIRCGTGTSNGTASAITLQKADASVTYLGMGPAYSDGIWALRPLSVEFDFGALGNPVTIKNTNTSAGSATFTLDCNNSAGIDALGRTGRNY